MLFQTTFLDRFQGCILPQILHHIHADIPYNIHSLILFHTRLPLLPHILADTWDGSFLHSTKSHLTEHPSEKSHRVAIEWIVSHAMAIDMLERIPT